MCKNGRNCCCSGSCNDDAHVPRSECGGHFRLLRLYGGRRAPTRIVLSAKMRAIIGTGLAVDSTSILATQPTTTLPGRIKECMQRPCVFMEVL